MTWLKSSFSRKTFPDTPQVDLPCMVLALTFHGSAAVLACLLPQQIIQYFRLPSPSALWEVGSTVQGNSED